MTTGPQQRDDLDAEHDAWLREALRHAPDATAVPPVALREAILAEARASTARGRGSRGGAKAPATSNPLLVFWHWLARPPVAAGFASVMAATLVGMMWWGRPLDETMPAPALPSTSTSTSTSPSLSAPAPSHRLERSPSTAATPTEQRAAAVATEPAGVDRIEKTGRRDRVAKSAPARNATGTAEGALATTPTPFPARTGTTDAAAEAARASPRVADAPIDALKNRAADAVPATPPMEPPAVAAKPPPMSALAAAPAPQRQARSRASEDGKDAQAFATAQPLAPLLAALDKTQESAASRVADERKVGADDALRRWLHELDTATAGRWHAAARDAEAANATSPLGTSGANGPRPRIEIGDAGSVRIEGSTVWLDVTGGGTTRRWQATLSPEVAARLQATRPRVP